jgi:hypothetical protein
MELDGSLEPELDGSLEPELVRTRVSKINHKKLWSFATKIDCFPENAMSTEDNTHQMSRARRAGPLRPDLVFVITFRKIIPKN